MASVQARTTGRTSENNETVCNHEDPRVTLRPAPLELDFPGRQATSMHTSTSTLYFVLE